MSVAIVFGTRYGTTEHLANRIAAKLVVDVQLHDLRENRNPDLGSAKLVIAGGPIYGGTLQRSVRAYLDRAQDELLSRELALFVSCFYTGEEARKQLIAAAPSALIGHAFDLYALGGGVALEKLSFFDRLMIRRLGGLTDSVQRINTDEISRLVADVNARLR